MVEVHRAEGSELERWDGYVERSPDARAFHYRGALEVLASHAGAKLHPLVGFKGQEVTGIVPLFEITRAGVSTVFSPPPDLLIPGLGPALCNTGKLKTRKAERRHTAFVESALEYVREEIDPGYVHVRTTDGYDDLRPLAWEGFDVTPEYTYLVDLTRGEEELLSAFSSDARKNVRDIEDSDCTVEIGDRRDARRIIREVQARYDEQGESYAVTPGFVADLHANTPEGTVKPYVCRSAGEFLGGMVVLDDGETVSRWQGGAKHDAEVPVNDLVDWTVMREAIGRGRERYDLVGANTRRLNGYKAKFAPDLGVYYSAERAGPGMGFVASIYRRLR